MEQARELPQFSDHTWDGKSLYPYLEGTKGKARGLKIGVRNLGLC